MNGIHSFWRLSNLSVSEGQSISLPSFLLVTGVGKVHAKIHSQCKCLSLFGEYKSLLFHNELYAVETNRKRTNQ